LKLAADHKLYLLCTFGRHFTKANVFIVTLWVLKSRYFTMAKVSFGGPHKHCQQGGTTQYIYV